MRLAAITNMQTLGNIQLFAEIKRSETGATYRGIDTMSQRLVVVKTFTANGGSPAAASRFEQEAQIYAGMTHPNLVQLFDYGVAGGLRYLTLEFVEGQNLRSLLTHSPHEGRLPVEIALTIFDEVLAGVAEIHRKSFIHRDLKPENILIGHDGSVKLCDFDLATSSQTRVSDTGLTGSPGYLAPEAILGEPVTPVSDIFALGILLYEMIAGVRPFQAASAGGEMNAIVRVAALPISTINPAGPAWLDELFDRLLAKKPAGRLKSAEEARAWLAQRFDCGSAATRRQRLQRYLTAAESYQALALSALERRAAESPQPQKTARRLRFAAVAGFITLAAVLVHWGSNWTTAVDSSKNFEEPTAQTISGDTLMPNIAVAPALAKNEKPVVRTSAAPPDDPVEVAADSAAVATSSLPRAVFIHSNPWAYVFIDADSIGLTPLPKPLALSAGAHTLLFKNPKFPPLSLPLVISSNTPDTLNFSLWEHVAQLELEINPWAEIYVNGERRALPAGEKTLILPPGKCELRFVHPQLSEKAETIFLRPGETRRLAINMF
jgi:serine/threonine-protein kinase